MSMMSTLAPSTPNTLSVRGLTTEVSLENEWFPVVRDIDLEIRPGQTLGVVGESGSGKTMLALTILGLLPETGVRVGKGSVELHGQNLMTTPRTQLRALLGKRIAAVFQDPLTSLNPLFTVGDQIREVIRRHSNLNRRDANDRAASLLEAVRIPDPQRRLRSYPHELSGGQRQRVAIAIAIANEPELLVLDEPTTALDVTVQAEILELLRELQDRMGMAMLFITHDLGVARAVCDRIAVMYAGRIMEEASAEELLAEPLHPYTRRLIACAPRLGHADELLPIPGMPPAIGREITGCPFADRCDIVMPECRLAPIDFRVFGDRRVACLRPGEKP